MGHPSRTSTRDWGRFASAAALLVAAFAGPVSAAQVRVAVAANFREAAIEVGGGFHSATGHSALFSFGSTGQLLAQIAQGAPFEVFLAADTASVERAIAAGLAVPDSRMTYAVGRLALFSRDEALVSGPEILTTARFKNLAIAEPAVAPYGRAAIEVLRALGAHGAVRDRLVRGQNVSQAFQFVYSGSAEMGFVALSQVILREGGSRWIVPEGLHAPIQQDGVLLVPGEASLAAREFLAFLGGPAADAVRHRFGYASAR